LSIGSYQDSKVSAASLAPRLAWKRIVRR